MAAREIGDLALEVRNGTYAPSRLEDCTGELTSDRSPSVARYVQFILFSRPDVPPSSAQEPEYLALQPHLLDRADGPSQPDRDRLLDAFSSELIRDLPSDALPAADADIGEIRKVLRELGSGPVSLPRRTAAAAPAGRPVVGGREPVVRPWPGRGRPHPDQPEAELRAGYAKWREAARISDVSARLEPLQKAGLAAPRDLPIDTADLQGRVRVLLDRILFPPPYRPFKDPHPHFALCVVYEQVWAHEGYTRGELINSISLAPGEQLTLEVQSWDKSTLKSEEELATESELRVAESINQRDVLNVVREVTERSGTSLNGGLSGKVPKLNLGFNLGGSFSTSAENKLTQSLEQTRERTQEAAQTLKNSRKLKIEIAREVGQETRQTRTIANTNRCHALNCHYFEVISNYLVSTRFVTAKPCLLLPNPLVRLTPAWVLCHEDVLKQVLLDKVFLPGFDAARTLEIEAAERERESAAPGTGGETPPPDDLIRFVDSIIDRYAALQSAEGAVREAASSSGCIAAGTFAGVLGLGICVATKVGIASLRRLLYLALMNANSVAVNALDKLESDRDAGFAPLDILSSFFASVTPRDYQYNVVAAQVAKGLDTLGIPKGVVDALLSWGLLDHLADDGGLYNAVRAAADKIERALPKPALGDDKDGAGGGLFDILRRRTDSARAAALFDQLACHIQSNLLHYLQAIWEREHADQRFLRLQSYGNVASLLEDEILGFVGHKTAYAITDVEPLKRWIDYADFVAKAEETMADRAGEPQLIAVPTEGTVLEAFVDECDACEDFIRQSRLIDLRVQTAKARQEESEADRYEKRVAAGDYTDPKAPVADEQPSEP